LPISKDWMDLSRAFCQRSSLHMVQHLPYDDLLGGCTVQVSLANLQ
jgi:hypothetical protein